MGEGAKGLLHGFSSPRVEHGNELFESSSFYGDSDNSTPSSSSELTDDATSSPPSSSSVSSNASQLDSNGSLFDLSTLMAELPIKRGLSKYFQGKSQSFRSLSDVRCLEDLAKEETPSRKKMKTCESHAGLGATQRPRDTPRLYSRTISKNASSGSCASSLARRTRSGLLCSSKPPALPLHKNF